MSDWNVPTTTDDYATVVLPGLLARDTDAGTMFYTAPTNQPDHSIRWNRATTKFQEWSTGGAAWADLAVSAGLGLGSMSTQNSNAVAITGGTLSGVTLSGGAITSNGTVTGLRGNFSAGVSRALTASTTFNADYAMDIHNLHATGLGLYIGVPSGGSALNIYAEVGGVPSAVLLSLTGAGILTVSGSGTHNFSAAGPNGIQITATGATQYGFSLVAAGTASGGLTTYAQTFSTSGYAIAGTTIVANDSIGVSLVAYNAAGIIRLFTNASNERMRIHASGGVSIGNTTDPGAGSLFVNSQLYMLSGAKIYPDGGGDTYIWESAANVVSIVAGGTTIIRNDGGCVKFPVQSGFFAYNSVDDAGVASGATVDFDTEIYDETGDFSADTFTAPVTGRYLFNVSVFINGSSGTDTRQANLVTSNRTYIIDYVGSAVSGQPSLLNGNVIADMDAGDTAYVQIQSGGVTTTVDGGSSPHQTWFSGRLLP